MPQHFSYRIFNHTAAHDSQFPGGLKLLNRKAFGIARQKNPLHFIPVIHLPSVCPVKIQITVPVPPVTSFREVVPSLSETLPAFSNLRHRTQEKGFHFPHSPCSHRPHFSTFKPYTGFCLRWF